MEICAADGMPSRNSYGIYVNTATGSQVPANLVLARKSFINSIPATTYGQAIPTTTLLATFDRQDDDITTGAGRVHWSTQRFAWQTMQLAWENTCEMATLQPAPPRPRWASWAAWPRPAPARRSRCGTRAPRARSSAR